MFRLIRHGLVLGTATTLTVLGGSLPLSASGDAGSVSIGDVRVWEGDDSPPDRTHTAVVPVTLAGPLLTTETVQYATTGGTATPGPATTSAVLAGADYRPRSGTLTFKPGKVVRYVVIKIYGDPWVEGDETIEITLSNPSSGLTLAKDTGTITIDELDGSENPDHLTDPFVGHKIGVNVSDVTVTEGDEMKRAVKFAVTLSHFCVDASVDYTLVPVTATGGWKGGGVPPVGSDFGDRLGATRTLVFSSTQVQKLVSVMIAPDLDPEADEHFTVVLSNPSSGGCNREVVAGPPGTGTVTDDDTA